MPKETTSRRAVLDAIKRVDAISELSVEHEGHYDRELDIEVIVYGRNYGGKRVGPYVKLLEFQAGEEIVHEGDWGGNCFYILVDGNAEVFIGAADREVKVNDIEPGVQFGEMSVLAGVPRAATVRASRHGAATVLEIQRPALRLLRKLKRFSRLLDAIYRRNGRKATLQEFAEATHAPEQLVAYLESISQFRVLSRNHILFRAGEPAKSLYILRRGWARFNGASDATEERYLGPMHCLGVDGIDEDTEWAETCILLGRTEVLEISLPRLRDKPDFLASARLALGKASGAPRDRKQHFSGPVVDAQRRLIETGLVDGTNLLLMDMQLCVRCGNCSLACHRVHGQSRLVRRGIQVTRPVKSMGGMTAQSLLSPSVCMHCQDPECLTGCPTGAIQRFGEGHVDIDPKTCIGCSDCANQCPYNAISMVPRKGTERSHQAEWKKWFTLKPEPLPPAVEQTEDLLAVKCNLCAGTPLNPSETRDPAYSCEENCPTGALLRVDPHIYFSEIKNIETLIQRNATHGIARHVSHRDRGKQLMHALGIAATLVLAGLTLAGITRYGLEKPIVSTWLNLRWITGLVGLTGIAGVMAYPARRRIYRRRVGPLRYWLLGHAYLGVIAGIVLLLHGGSRSGGVLTTALMITFDLVIATGLFGILCYYLVPRMLTRIEEQPLLVEDLTARREELEREIAERSAELNGEERSILQVRVIPSLCSVRYLVDQYFKPSSLDERINQAKQRFLSHLLGIASERREKLLEIIANLVTLRRVEALWYLHRLLKLWLLPHVLTTSLMIALMAVHIIQAVFFAVR